MKKPKIPKLIPIDLSKCCKCDKDGSGKSWHPDIDEKHQYLALLGTEFHSGYFTRQWFGWLFDTGWTFKQLDKPGTNNSKWKGLWRIVK